MLTAFTVMLGVLSSNALAQTEWEKYSANPVLDMGQPGTWDDGGISYPAVLFDGAEFKMWYAGYDGYHWRIGCATSSDGVAWHKHPNPVVDLGANGEWDDGWVANCSVVFDGSEYKMWYHGGDGSHYRIGYATSVDGIEWDKYSDNPVMNLGPPGAWDDDHVGLLTVLLDGTEFKMWYSGAGGSGWSIGYATSVDGIEWDKYADNPVLDIGQNGEWDDYQVNNPTVLSGCDNYEMWYTGDDGDGYQRVGYATSVDGIEWDKYADNPVLDIGQNGTWDDAFACQAAVLSNRTEYKMWYSGMTRLGNSQLFRIGYATSKKCPMEIVSSEPVAAELHQFRDRVLMKNDTGQKLISLYYEHASEITDVLLDDPLLSIRSAAILKDVMPGILFLLGNRRGRDIVMTPLRAARIKKLFADIGAQGSVELAQTLSMLSNMLEQCKGMRVSQIWRTISVEGKR